VKLGSQSACFRNHVRCPFCILTGCKMALAVPLQRQGTVKISAQLGTRKRDAAGWSGHRRTTGDLVKSALSSNLIKAR